MSDIFHEKSECKNVGYVLDVPATLSKPNKRWHLAFATIFCSRVFLSLLKDAVAEKENEISCSHSILLVKPDLDQPILTQLVKQKDLDQLLRLGGVEGVASFLKTDIEKGIHGDGQDNDRRQEVFGSNTYPNPPAKSFFHFVVKAFKNPTVSVLLCCAAFSLGFGIKEHGLKDGWYDGVSIIVAVFLLSLISASIKFKQNRQIDKLSEVSNNILVDVVRSGQWQQISRFDIVVGDVVCLKSGDQVPADGLLLDGHSLQVDESRVTGETLHVKINCSQNPFLISGSMVADGYARMLVISVGMNTTWGEMMSSINSDSSEQTPLQAQLSKLTSSISKVGLAVAFLVLVVLLVRYFTGNTKDENGNREFSGSKTKVDDIVNAMVGVITVVVTIVVVAIPEGLHLAITFTLVYTMNKMMDDQAMVRKLSACETMGFVTTICTDRTSILTLNQKKVTMFSLGHQCIRKDTSSIAPNVVEFIQQGLGLNTAGRVYGPPSGSQFEFSGSPTEKAILSWVVLELKTNMEELKRGYTILHAEAFNSKRKRSGVLMRKNADNTIHVHWKGAAEMILAMCSSYYDASGNVKALDDGERLKFERTIQAMADSSLHCIAFAHKKVLGDEHENRTAHQNLQEDCLTLLGLAGIKDTYQRGVKKAVGDCQHAGVNIKMITGDNVFTARAIATECGIIKPNQHMDSGAVVEGVEFRNYSPEERMEKVDKICVMARSSPSDKLLMVQCLKQKGHVVAFTGDDTNDAPALKEADIGLSMGIQGTEVAKESSDIVILDDNFTSVATVLRWGRCVYNNIQKFVQFQLTMNVAALVINFVAAISVNEIPLTPLHLLWVNLLVDPLGALALATDQPTEELMEKPPMGGTESLITNVMWRNLIAQVVFQIAIQLTLQFKGESIFGVNEKAKGTLIFNTSILCQVFNKFNARKLEKKNVFEGINENKLFMGIVGITIVLQLAMVEFLKSFAEIERPNWGQWATCVAIASFSWPIGWVVKCIPVSNKPFFSYLKW